jgi:hypothetical protein
LKGKPPAVLEVRGEVYMTHKAFEALNKRQENDGKPTYANPRNSAAGSVRQLDPSITASRALNFFAYTWGDISELPAKTQSGMLEKFEEHGFIVNPLVKKCETLDQILKFYRESKSNAPSWAMTLTAWSTRWTGWICRSGWDSCRARRVGPSPTNSPPNRPRRCWRISKYKSAARANSRRWRG